MKTGRNDPCPCGSGKKYKRCCLAAANLESQTPVNLGWSRIRRAIEGLSQQMLLFFVETYGSDGYSQAWGEFSLWDEEIVDEDQIYFQIFAPWMLHCWVPHPEAVEIDDESLMNRAPTAVYLERKGRRLRCEAREYLQACLTAPFSFFEVSDCRSGTGFKTRDIFTGKRCTVLEHGASKALTDGDLLFGQLVEVEGLTLIEACTPIPLQPADLIRVLEVRENLCEELCIEDRLLTIDELRAAAEHLRALYLEITKAALHPALPLQQNTDGEAIVEQRLLFDIDSPQAAFEALAHLDFEAEVEELLDLAELDSNGSVRRVDIRWKKPGNRIHASWTNTIMGEIKIDGSRMTVDVNSDERADLIRDIVERALGERAKFRMAEVKSGDALIAQAQAQAGEASPADPPTLPADPEARAQLQATLQQTIVQQYDDWVDRPVPALDGLSPREAVREAGGREKVEALVRQAERYGRSMQPPVDAAVYRKLRDRLGLA